MPRVFKTRRGNLVFIRKARKPHRCSKCYNIIRKGETYYEVKYTFSTKHSKRYCKLCWNKKK